MLHDTPLITAISMGLVLAFAFGSLALKFRLSPLVGYLFAGVIAGLINRSPLINLEMDKNLLEQLAELGVILLMFGVGLNFSPKDLMSVKKIAVPGALLQILITATVGTILIYLVMGGRTDQVNAIGMYNLIMAPYGISLPQVKTISLGGAIIFGLSLSVASTVVLLRSLEERSAMVTERGKTMIGWLIVEDMVMVLVLVILPALAPTLGGKSVGVISAESVWISIIQTLIMVTLFIVLMLTFGKKMIPLTLEKVALLGSKEVFTLSVLAIALGVALGAAYLFGVSLALGAFFAGMMMNESELSLEAAQDSLPLRDAFAVLFFVSVGLQLDLDVFWEHPLMLLGTLLIILFCKSVATFSIVRLFGYSKETALTIGVSLAQIGEFSFILITLGVSLQLVDETAKSLILSAAILSIVINPFLFKLLDRWIRANQDKLKNKIDQNNGIVHSTDEDLRILVPEREHAIVVGYGRVGCQLVRILQEKQIPLVVIENEPLKAEKAQKSGLPVIMGNAAAEEIMHKANPATASMLLIASSQPFEEGAMINHVSKVNPVAIIVARAETDAAVDYLLNHGAHGAVMEIKELAFSMMEMAEAGKRLAQRGLWPAVPADTDDTENNKDIVALQKNENDKDKFEPEDVNHNQD